MVTLARNGLNGFFTNFDQFMSFDKWFFVVVKARNQFGFDDWLRILGEGVADILRF